MSVVGAEVPWSERWLAVVEQLMENEGTPKGAGSRLARRDVFDDVELSPGLLAVSVEQGGHSYRVQLGIKVLDDSEWEKLAQQIADVPSLAVSVMLGDLPEAVADDNGIDVGLVPAVDELYPDCNCGSWDGLCVHVSAALSKAADLIDHDPFVLTTLRGKSRHELKGLVESRRNPEGSQQRVLSGHPRGADAGVSAAAAYRRDSRRLLPPSRHTPGQPGRPLPVAVEPPLDSGVYRQDILDLVAAASEHALQQLHRMDEGGVGGIVE